MTTLVTARPEELLGRLTDLACRGAARVLYLQGDRSLLELGTRVAVVGSRQGHRHGGPRPGGPHRPQRKVVRSWKVLLTLRPHKAAPGR